MAGNKQSSERQLGSVATPSPTLSPTSTLFETSPRSPIRHRPTFTRLASALNPDTRRYDAVEGEDDITAAPSIHKEEPRIGLGISCEGDISQTSVHETTDTMYESGAGKGVSASQASISSYPTSHNKAKQSTTSFQSSLQHGFTASADTQPLHPRQSFPDTLKNTYDGFSPSQTCVAHAKTRRGCTSWSFILTMIMSVYSTALSCIYLVIAIGGIHWPQIRSTGTMTLDTATLITSIIAKTIELSFVTVFVSFLGQVLWRRAFLSSQHRGVTLAEIDMRSWVMQPGTVLTHFSATRSSALTLLGALTLITVVTSTLYTSASQSLVQPKLKYGKWANKTMNGLVKTSWANPAYLSEQCATPVITDGEDGPLTCVQIAYAAQSFHNYQRYLADWTGRASEANGSTELNERPQGFALLFENTTVTGHWLQDDTGNGTKLVDGRIINNISMAMPHAAVISAAKDSTNGILQPEDLDNIGVYSLHASLWSPAINVLCANMKRDELTPIVYNDSWTGERMNSSTWATEQSPRFIGPDYINNKTAVDDIFGWGPSTRIAPPVFAKFPTAYNTILNQTGLYGRKSIYLLGKGPPNLTDEDDYVLCSMKAFQSMSCSTRYNVSSSGARLEALCEDDDDDMQYIRKNRNASMGSDTISTDWVAGAGEWANSIMLNSGITDGDASNARLFTQLIMSKSGAGKSTKLNPDLPSPAEALAVMAGATLVTGTLDANILPYWSYTGAKNNILRTGRREQFQSKLRAQQYASGGNKQYQHGLFVILILVFVTNVFCLIYFTLTREIITDFSEPVNLFSLAINSPPSDSMAGSCGGSPQSNQYQTPWSVNAAGDHLYMVSGATKDDEEGYEMRDRAVTSGKAYKDSPISPVYRAFRRLSKQASLL